MNEVMFVTGDWTKSAAVCVHTRITLCPEVISRALNAINTKLTKSSATISQGLSRQTSF